MSSDSAVTVGVISALPEEIRRLGDHLEVADKIARGGSSFRVGRIDGIPVVLVEAGIGKVNTALVATLLFDHFRCESVLFTGVAGGIDPSLAIGDVVVADRLIQHDYGAVVGEQIKPYRPGALPYGEARDDPVFPLDPALTARLRRQLDGFELPMLPAAATGGAARRPALRFGTIVSGDQFINCEATRRRLFAQFRAQAVEMEGAALAQVAQQFGAPAVTVRCLSDLAGAESHMDFMAFLSSASEIAAAVLRRVLPAM
jgi:adenosylhomocysteine nucleosidase